eukprot:6190018-Pleurochrysis_carterae.AAC.1
MHSSVLVCFCARESVHVTPCGCARAFACVCVRACVGADKHVLSAADGVPSNSAGVKARLRIALCRRRRTASRRAAERRRKALQP